MTRAALLVTVILGGCVLETGRLSATVTCAPPFATDPAREGRLAAILSTDPEARALVTDLPTACFGPVRAPSPGVLVDGRPVLAASGSDDELAARLAHLGVHAKEDLGDGCRQGRARAIASEEKARALETRLRARAGLGPAPDDAKTPIADYAARCDRP